MTEEIVKEIFIKYLKNKGEYSRPRNIHSRGADILIKGRAYEIKGSDLDKNRVLKQLIAYTFDYERVSLALPYDVLDCFFIHQLKTIEKFLNLSIELYLVAERNNKTYSIYRFGSSNLLEIKIEELLYQLGQRDIISLSSEEKERKSREYILRLEEKIRGEIKNFIITNGEIVNLIQ